MTVLGLKTPTALNSYFSFKELAVCFLGYLALFFTYTLIQNQKHIFHK